MPERLHVTIDDGEPDGLYEVIEGRIVEQTTAKAGEPA
jgi:hypothetical protein